MRVSTRRATTLGPLLLAFLPLACFLLAGCSSPALETHTDSAKRTARPVVVAIGDSIMKGHGLKASESWPAMLAATNGWDLTNLACDGAGFVTTGDTNDCGEDYSGLVREATALHPDLILISGSSNDLGIDNATLSTETLDVVTSLRKNLPTTTIFGISTVWNHTATPSQMDDINRQVRAAITGVGGTYFDIGQPLAGHRSWLQDDEVHPTVMGQEELAKVIARSIRESKLSI